MGNIIAINIFSLDFSAYFQPTKPEGPNWAYYSFFLILLVLIGLTINYVYKNFKFVHKQNHRQNNKKSKGLSSHTNTRPVKTLIKQFELSSICIIFFLILFLPPPALPFPKRKGKYTISKVFKTVGKPTAKFSLPIFASSALYFGMESLSSYIQEHPESSAAIFSLLGCFISLFIILILKLATLLHKYFSRSQPPQTDQPIEMSEIRNNLEELILRSDPPRPPTSQ